MLQNLICDRNLTSTIRIPTEIYEVLRQIRVGLESEHQSAAPAMQDLATVAFRHFIDDWNDPQKREVLLAELLENRKIARTNMGKPKVDKSSRVG
ncbi:CopG-like ribbon-helix-helix domain-containing protein [Tumidithrix helvetica PCC 7403]|uniref:hypothetical protein n=1 Tax=Tumidithrix helvetica TaxID=3457545 RepID=UPI003CB57DAA